ncbi:unconventional myosin-IXb-like isoform X1 [Paramormyrops kingsleyae]|uniref:unconventional myosin-IXb-like n=1 Tax=Paramormyrops kingsleyae TaxID=1676925 RepID=UPI003B971E90
MGLSASSCRFATKCRFFRKLLKKRPRKDVQLSDQGKKPMEKESIHRLLEHIELHGLQTEGIYRKPGSVKGMRELRQQLEKDPMAVCLEDYPIHCVTGLVSEWLRNLPEPLTTFSQYSGFLHAMEPPEKSEQLGRISQVLDMLPPASIDMLERLFFHLVRVASEEGHNRMSTHSLAIVFAPSILRPPNTTNPLDIMKDMSKITMCLELILNEQKRRYEELNEGEENEIMANCISLTPCRLYRAQGQNDLDTIPH